MKNYYCSNCGEPKNDPYDDLCSKCYHDEYYDKCKCGNSKCIEDDLCRSCEIEETERLKKEKYGSCICPICRKEYLNSEYLHKAIPNERTRLVANLITHYRHVHQKSWNKSCHYVSQKWGEIAYENSKKEHNNRAKRQILRKCGDWLTMKGITKDDFLELSDNDQMTIDLINKKYNIN